MTVTVAAFLDAFPEFQSSDRYTEAAIEFWIGVGEKMLRPERWEDLLDHGVMLFTAHNLVLSAKNIAASVNGFPGAYAGAIASKSVDKLSISYDTTSGTVSNAGAYNMSTYGIQFIYFARLIGAGGVQL